jgi:hypothetical protein
MKRPPKAKLRAHLVRAKRLLSHEYADGEKYICNAIFKANVFYDDNISVYLRNLIGQRLQGLGTLEGWLAQ